MSRLAALFGLVLASCAASEPDAPVPFVWAPEKSWQGGFSAIHVFDGGDRAWVLSDSAFLLDFALQRDAAGDIASVEYRFLRTLPADDGAERLPEDSADSEGLAVAPDGSFYVSFEGPARVRHEPAEEGPPEMLPQPREFRGLQSNGALEALAIGADGTLYTIPERSGRFDRPFPVYRFRDGVWDVPFTLPRRGEFVVTGADIGPDGRFYVVERDFNGIGFRSRVRRFDMSGGSEEVLLESPVGQYDNLEGISVWSQSDGRLRLTMISDDNYRWFQRTELVELMLDD